MLQDHSPQERGHPRKKGREKFIIEYGTLFYFPVTKSVNPSFFFFRKKRNPKGSKAEVYIVWHVKELKATLAWKRSVGEASEYSPNRRKRTNNQEA